MTQFNTNTRQIYRVQDLMSELDQVTTILKLLNSFDLSDEKLVDIMARKSALALFFRINNGTRSIMAEAPSYYHSHLPIAFACVSPRCLLRNKYEAVPFSMYDYICMYETGVSSWYRKHRDEWKTACIIPRSLTDVDDVLSMYCERSSDEIRWSTHQAYSDMYTLQSYLLATIDLHWDEHSAEDVCSDKFATLWFEYPREDCVDKVAASIYGSTTNLTRFDSLLRDAMTLYDASMFHLATGLNRMRDCKVTHDDMLTTCQKIVHCLGGIAHELDSLLRKKY